MANAFPLPARYGDVGSFLRPKYLLCDDKMREAARARR